jgi:hypothetical protein
MRTAREFRGAVLLLGVAALASACRPAGEGEGQPALEVDGSPMQVASVLPGGEPAGQSAAALEPYPGDPYAAPEWPAVEAAVRAQVDSADRRLRRVPGLTSDERARLRRDVNAVQIERAQQLGIRAGASVEQLTRAGRLVRLPDTTQYWVIRPLSHSVPYVTPDTEALLHEIGARFHAKLDSLGIPRYRLDLTSILRTPEHQAALRRGNANASRTDSAHEFGTTVDIAYRRFAPPEFRTDGLPAPALAHPARMLADTLFIETGRLRGTELQAVLGRVLATLQQEGKLLVRMENGQTVYHLTVARRFPPRQGAGAAN